jgi:hypothetical protein
VSYVKRATEVVTSGRATSISLLVCNALLCLLIGICLLRPNTKPCQVDGVGKISQPSNSTNVEAVPKAELSSVESEAVLPVSKAGDSVASLAPPESKALTPKPAHTTRDSEVDLEKFRELTRGL